MFASPVEGMRETKSNGPPEEWHRGQFVISADRERVNLDVVHAFLTESLLGQRNFA